MQTADIKNMRSIVANNVRFFYETDKNGNKIIRHILVGSARNILAIPADGITIDTVPSNSVGSEQIVNASVQMEDLSPEAREAMENQFATDDDVRAALDL